LNSAEVGRESILVKRIDGRFPEAALNYSSGPMTTRPSPFAPR